MRIIYAQLRRVSCQRQGGLHRMRTTNKFFFLSALTITLSLTAAAVRAEEPTYQPPVPMQNWLSDTQNEDAIKPGTTINSGNWQQYRQFMSYGLQILFSSSTF